MPTASSRKYGKCSRTSSGKFRLSVATERQTGTRVHDRMRHGHGFDSHIRSAPENGRSGRSIASRVRRKIPLAGRSARSDRSGRRLRLVGRIFASAGALYFSEAHSLSPIRVAGLRLPAKNQEMVPRAQVRLSMPARRFFDSESRRSGLFAYFCLQTTRVC